MMDKEFRKIVQTRAIPVQRLVLSAHSAIEAVFAAKIGDFNHAAQENAATELAANGFHRPGMQPFLLLTAASYKLGTLRHPIYDHGGSKRALWPLGKRNLLRECALRLHAGGGPSKPDGAEPRPNTVKPLNR